jgi:hypothetical protein
MSKVVQVKSKRSQIIYTVVDFHETKLWFRAYRSGAVSVWLQPNAENARPIFIELDSWIVQFGGWRDNHNKWIWWIPRTRGADALNLLPPGAT